MQSTSLGSFSGRSYARPVATSHAASCDIPVDAPRASRARIVIIVLYTSVTVLDLVRGIIHAFLYEVGLDDISGLATGDALCDGRLAAIMIGYGGANLESFLVRSYILYSYIHRHDGGRGLVRASSMAATLWAPLAETVSVIGDVDVGDADVPGRYAMLVRSVVSFGVFLLTLV